MHPRHAVLLTAPTVDPRLPSARPEERRATPLESTLVEVFILNTLNLFRINTYWGGPHFAQFLCNLSPFRINTCKSVSKQTTLSPFRINTYEKTGGWGRVHFPSLRKQTRGRPSILTSLLRYFLISFFKNSGAPPAPLAA